MEMRFERERSAGYMTNLTARLFARAMDRKLRGSGVSTGHLPVFFALGNGGALSQKALTELAAVEQPTMAATLSRMERDGLVTREPDPADRRSSLFALTPKAMEKTELIRVAVAEINGLAAAALTAEQMPLYLDMLKRIVAALEPEA
jgi:DNA-binding MarR family transcriptional regulator